MSIIYNGHYRMKHRTWIIEALRLHFEEHLPRIEAGRRLGIPKTTVCDLFVRFRKAGFLWPLPSGMSEHELDARLYRSLSAVPAVVPEVTVMPEAPAVRKRARRPNFTHEFKISLVEQSLLPGTNVTQLAREHNINDNQLFNWRRLYRRGELLPRPGEPTLLPVMLAPEPTRNVTAPASVAESMSDEALCCELVLPSGTVRLKGTLTPALLQMLIREMKGASDDISPGGLTHLAGCRNH
ncbi:IS66-like element accessory protein TnpA [Salmonella enterica]|nr:transposase [Salmonella enterica]